MSLASNTLSCQAPALGVEKRRSPRYPFSSAAEVIDRQGDTRIFGRLSDIASAGCYVDTISPFAKNVAVHLTVTKEHQIFKTEARVVYSMLGMGMGLFFTSTDPDQVQVLAGWLEELSGGKPSQKTLPNLIPQPEATKRSDHELRTTLSDLIAMLNSKKILNDSEGMALMRKLSK